MDHGFLAAAIEAILYIVEEPVKRDKLLELFSDVDAVDIETSLEKLRDSYSSGSRGILLREIAGGFQLSTRPEYDEYIREYLKVKRRSQLSRQALETLSIIAYEQPITIPEIKEIRGTDPSGVIRTLLERKLVRIAGRKEVIGRPFLYTTSEEFLIHFGLASLDDLPRPDDFAGIMDEEKDEINSTNLVRFEER